LSSILRTVEEEAEEDEDEDEEAEEVEVEEAEADMDLPGLAKGSEQEEKIKRSARTGGSIQEKNLTESC
jgi:hypothetical protein